MESSWIKAALSDLEREMESARSARQQIERAYSGARVSASTATWEDPKVAFPWLLTNIYEMLLVVLEAAELPQTRQRLMETWDYFEKHGGVGKTSFHPEYLEVEGKPFEYLGGLINSLRILAGGSGRFV